MGDSQAAKLGSHFSLMMLVTVPTEKLDGLKSSLTSMTDTNVAIFETKGSEKSFTPTIACTLYVVVLESGGNFSHTCIVSFADAATFSLKGADNPGIMHKMTSAFVKHGLSIDKLETDQEIAPYGGALLFKMRGVATAAAPLASGFDADKIKKQLIELGDSLNCDVVVEDIADDSYQGSFYAG